MSNGNLNESALEELQGKVMGDIGGALGVLMAYIGDELGVFQALADANRATAQDLARRADLDERYVREWLSAVAAAGYVNYDPISTCFSVTPEQAALFAHEGTPLFMHGFFQCIVGAYADYEKIRDIFRTGEGLGWGEHHNCAFCGTDRFFRPGYDANLVSNWIPALSGVEKKLKRGAKVADIGCGYGSSTILMAKTYPHSMVYGFDFHEPSIEEARKRAFEAGVENVKFEVATAKGYPGTDYDLATVFDALHDMGDPVGAAAHVRKSLKKDGTFMVVEPLAGDKLEDNLHLLGQIFYSFSTAVCTGTSRAQEVGLALGAQAGQKRLTDVLNAGGFGRVRRAAETATNMVLEARA